MRHIPVILHETIEALALKPGDRVIDATVGDGGHSEEILKKIGSTGKVLALDADPESLLRAERFLYPYRAQVSFVRTNFSDLEKTVREQEFFGASGILMDLGWSMPQFKERGRGFSFENDEPLDMRYDPSSHILTAEQIINESSQSELEKIVRYYGEEPLSRLIAEAIVDSRKQKQITTTSELVNIILAVYRKKLHSTKEIPWTGGIHPSTRTFQALRIAVNHELDILKQTLPQALSVLKPGGRLAVITFHSLEDRIVKHFFVSEQGKKGNIITKKPYSASESEVARNAAARSAKLRVFQKN